MIEVFRTNVCCNDQADELVRLIHLHIPGHHANFDLNDVDHILRVVSEEGKVLTNFIIAILEQRGFECTVLPDTLPVFREHMLIETFSLN